jgi:predicted DNA-binding ribbon-helix-helix protein
MRKRSIAIRGHRTSICLEVPFWDALEDFAHADGLSLPGLIAEIDLRRLRGGETSGLASALRVYALERLRRSAGGGER